MEASSTETTACTSVTCSTARATATGMLISREHMAATVAMPTPDLKAITAGMVLAKAGRPSAKQFLKHTDFHRGKKQASALQTHRVTPIKLSTTSQLCVCV